MGRKDEWEAGDSMQREEQCRRGQGKVKEHARMDYAAVITLTLVSFGPQLSPSSEHSACLWHRSCETTALNKRNDFTLAQTGPFASMSPMLVN